jgi:hypothetical protein
MSLAVCMQVCIHLQLMQLCFPIDVDKKPTFGNKIAAPETIKSRGVFGLRHPADKVGELLPRECRAASLRDGDVGGFFDYSAKLVEIRVIACIVARREIQDNHSGDFNKSLLV